LLRLDGDDRTIEERREEITENIPDGIDDVREVEDVENEIENTANDVLEDQDEISEDLGEVADDAVEKELDIEALDDPEKRAGNLEDDVNKETDNVADLSESEVEEILNGTESSDDDLDKVDDEVDLDLDGIDVLVGGLGASRDLGNGMVDVASVDLDIDEESLASRDHVLGGCDGVALLIDWDGLDGVDVVEDVRSRLNLGRGDWAGEGRQGEEAEGEGAEELHLDCGLWGLG